MGNSQLVITPEKLRQLRALRLDSKFHAEQLYPGTPDEGTRICAERAVNLMLDQLLSGVEKSPTKAYVLSQFRTLLPQFEDADSEERERMCDYCERVMTILGIEGSDGLLNTWLYGFDPGDKT